MFSHNLLTLRPATRFPRELSPVQRRAPGTTPCPAAYVCISGMDPTACVLESGHTGHHLTGPNRDGAHYRF